MLHLETNREFMKKIRLIKRWPYTIGLLGMLLVLFSVSKANAQTNYTASSISIKVSGNSNLHNWDVKSATAAVSATIATSPAGTITALSALNFSTPVIALKGEHSGMDKNIYKALKKDTYPNISFVLKAATIANNTIKCLGTLTIAGKSTETELLVFYTINTDKTITVTGTKKINMLDYGIEPPTALFGTIKTGKDVVLSFTVVMK
jgi:polyisoprenoid-binding protein YceI